MTEWLHFHFSLSSIGEGNDNPLQCSCLENPRDGGAWWAAIYGVTQSQIRLKLLSSSSSSKKIFFFFFFYARRYLIATLMGWIVPLAPIYMLKSYPKQVSQNVTLFGEGLYWDNQASIKSLQWILIYFDQCLIRRGNLIIDKVNAMSTWKFNLWAKERGLE